MKRKAQGAIEYLFMIAAALVIILIVVRQLRNKSGESGKSADLSAKQSKVELLAQKYNGTSAWDSSYNDLYNKCMGGDAKACDDLISKFPND